MIAFIFILIMSGISISSVNPNDGGTAVITMTFTDEDGNTVIPINLQWQLMDKFRNVINSRSFANGSFTGNTVVLSGDDLLLQSDTDEGDRYFGVRGNYDSSAGSGLPLTDELKFTIQNLVNIDGA